MVGGYRRGRGRAQLGRGAAIGAFDAPGLERGGDFLGRRRAAHRRTHGEIDPMHLGHLGLPAGQHTLGIVRLNPALEEPGWNRLV